MEAEHFVQAHGQRLVVAHVLTGPYGSSGFPAAAIRPGTANA
ncbi:hypothetical protein MXAN_5249 [Myxococcus xanthus DK 1622]|uniref:Uncharacterized protein n=1 Tax=Myxococcus xanthus (strain DK1622) TaxID=246197 RepID=Q1D1S2_MYXXD|nr:hypothetical protein MXAN_5249 [Myxococcus xanthus DK 1622]